MSNKNKRPNLLKLLLSARFKSPDEFIPDVDFHRKTGISKIRFTEIIEDRSPISGKEYAAVARYLDISKEEALETRQLKLFK